MGDASAWNVRTRNRRSTGRSTRDRRSSLPKEAPMPAVTVENTLTLPRTPEVDPMVAHDRPVLAVTTAPSGFEGEGFPVRRAFAGVDLARLDPFIHMDQMGEVDYAPG